MIIIVSGGISEPKPTIIADTIPPVLNYLKNEVETRS